MKAQVKTAKQIAAEIVQDAIRVGKGDPQAITSYITEAVAGEVAKQKRIQREAHQAAARAIAEYVFSVQGRAIQNVVEAVLRRFIADARAQQRRSGAELFGGR